MKIVNANLILGSGDVARVVFCENNMALLAVVGGSTQAVPRPELAELLRKLAETVESGGASLERDIAMARLAQGVQGPPAPKPSIVPGK